MAKRGDRQGYVAARVNSHVETRSIVADALALELEQFMAYPYEVLPADCVNTDGLCCACCGCCCPPYAKFARDFNSKWAGAAA